MASKFLVLDDHIIAKDQIVMIKRVHGALPYISIFTKDGDLIKHMSDSAEERDKLWLDFVLALGADSSEK